MIQQSFDDDFLVMLVVLFVVPVGETAPSTTGKKRPGGSKPPHCELEGPALPDEGALDGLVALDCGGTGNGVARKLGFPVIANALGPGVMVVT